MIVGFVIVVMIAAAVAVTLTRLKKLGVILGTLIGTVAAVLSSLMLMPLPEGNSGSELLMNRLVVSFLFAFAGAALGKWTSPAGRTNL